MSRLNKNIFDQSLSSVLLLLALLIGLNILVAQKYIYADLTQDKIYTTSDATKNILKNLNKDVSVTFYISKDLPVDLLNVKTQLVDMMNQYQDIAGAKLKITYQEPDNSEAKVAELAGKGIPQMQFNVIAKDKYEVKQGFFGAEITAGEGDTVNKEAIPIIQSAANIEYDFISAIYSVSRESKENLAFLEGQGEKQIQLPDLAKYYNVSSVKIQNTGDKKGFYFEKAAAKEGDKPEQVFVNPKTLIIAGPTQEITNDDIAQIVDYVKKGGNLIILAETESVDNSLKVTAVKNNLNELVKSYGIKINDDLIYDQYNSNIPYSTGMFQLSTPYPYWVKAQRENFGDNASLSALQSLVFPWVSSLSIIDGGDYEPKTLISSSNRSGLSSGTFNLMPGVSMSYNNSDKKIISIFSQPKDKSSQSGSVYVIGDSDFILPYFIGNYPDNSTFFMNLVDSISNSVNLSTIRAKSITDRPIKELDESQKNYWKFGSVFAAAIALDIYGFFRIMKRKKGNK